MRFCVLFRNTIFYSTYYNGINHKIVQPSSSLIALEQFEKYYFQSIKVARQFDCFPSGYSVINKLAATLHESKT